MLDLEQSVNEEMNDQIMSPITAEEARRTTFDINPNKCPGPDDMTGFFYKQLWDNMERTSLRWYKVFSFRVNWRRISMKPTYV